MLINPSRNFNKIASKHYHNMPPAIRFLLRFAGVTKNSESALISYLMFEKPFTQELIQLGYEDGLEQIDSISEYLELKI